MNCFKTKFVLFAMLAMCLPSSVLAATGLTYHGRIIKPNSQPLEAASVFFQIQIRSPNTDNCLLYEEQQSLNMSGSKGVFVLTIGEGARVLPAVDGGYSISRLFANRGTMNALTCSFGNSYSPATADGRKLVVQFNDGTGWQALPAQNINYVPLAIEAMQIGGYGTGQLLRVADGTTATEFSNANWTELWNLITGASTVYQLANGSNFLPTASVDFNGQKIIDLADPTLATDGTNKQYVDGRVGGKTVDVTGVSNLAGDGRTLIWDQAGNRWITGAVTDSTKLPLAGGTMLGSISLGGTNSLTNIGHVQIADQGTLYLGKFTAAQETTLLATPLNNTTDRGRSWFNTTTNKMRIWNGITASDVGADLGYTPVNKAGDTMSGLLVLSADPSAALGAATKQYVDAVTNATSGTAFRKDGTTLMTGNIQLNSNWLSNDGGNEGLRVDNTGKVGIGVPAPTWPLDVAGRARFLEASNGVAQTLILLNSSAAADYAASIDFQTGLNVSQAKVVGAQENAGLTNGYLTIQTRTAGAVTEKMRVTSAGNVGIGTISPNRLLEVAGPIRVVASALPGTPAAGDIAVDSGDSNKLKYYNGSAWVAVGSGSGDALIANPLSQFAATTSAQLASTISDETGTGLAVFDTSPTITTPTIATSATIPLVIGGTTATSPLTYKTTTAAGTTGADHIFQVGNNGATEAMRILNDGKVGIGTTSPNQLLTVEGVTSLREVASAPTTSVNYGKIYVKTDSKLYYMDDSGAEKELGTATGALSSVSSISNTAGVTFNSDSDNASSDGGFNFQRNGTNLLTINNAGDIAISSTTVSTTTGTGSIVVGGGIGAGGSINAGGRVSSAGGFVTMGGVNLAYTPTSVAFTRPYESNSQAPVVLVRNSSSIDGGGSFVTLGSNNGSANIQHAYIGAVSTTGAGVYTPSIVFGQQSGATAYNERMRIDANGDVGIGTTNPSARLDVVDSGTAAISSLENTYNSSGSYAALRVRRSRADAVAPAAGMAGGVEFSTEGNTDGAYSVTGRLMNGWETAPTSAPNRNGFFAFETITGGTLSEKVRINAAGYLGVGTVAPVEMLDVSGAIKMGNSVAATAGTMRWNGTNFQAHNGTAWQNLIVDLPASGACDTTQSFTTPGTHAYTVPASFGTITVRAWGGGGGGNYGSSGSSGFLGKVGQGSTVSSLGLTAGGGSGGSGSIGGVGGIAGGGDTNTSGASGTNEVAGVTSGSGGSSPNGGTGGGGGAFTGGATAGTAGGAPGGGGGGASSATTSGGGGGAGAYVEKTFTSGVLLPGTTISDIIVGDGGDGGCGGTCGGRGGVGRVTITCSSTGAPPANDRGILFLNAGAFSSSSTFIHDSSGNVAIGTSAANAKLTVEGTTSLREVASAPASTANYGKVYVKSSDSKLYFMDAAGVESAISGAYGSGSSIQAGAGTVAAPSLSFSGEPDTGLYSNGANTIGVSAGNLNIFNLSSLGLVSSTTGGASASTANGTATAPTFSFKGDEDTGWYRAAADTLAASTAGTERMRIDASGNVGIGRTPTSEKLEVEGGVKLGNTIGALAGTLRWTGVNFQGYDGTSWYNILPNPPAAGACDTTQTFNTPGNHAYTVPASYSTITIRLWGGGGGGGTWGSTTGSSGAASTISSLALSAGGGTGGGGGGAGGLSGNGGAASGGAINTAGNSGGSGGVTSPSGSGGSAPFGGTGGGGCAGVSNGSAGGAPGAGGGGGCHSVVNQFGAGGGSGAYVEKTFTPGTLPTGTTINDIIVGAGAAATNTGGGDGGAGGDGRVTVSCSTTGTPSTIGWGSCSIAAFAATSGSNSQTCTGVSAGTPIYCSPTDAPATPTVTWGARASAANTVDINLSANFTTSTTWKCMFFNP